MIITTSRKPSRHSISLAKELSKSFPKSFYFSRGKKSIELLAEETLNSGEEFALIVSEMHGNPTEIKIIKVSKNEWNYFCTIRIKLLKSRKDFTEFKSKIPEIKIKIESEKLKKLLKKLEVNSINDSEFELIEKNNVLSFFRTKKEIGPQIRIEGIIFE